MSDLQNRIKQLKQEKNAVILAHYYVHDEVQEIADYIGDSFYLSKVATKTDADTIVFCGVSFMGESTKILNPEKTVLMPDETADCPMAHMADIDRIEELTAKIFGLLEERPEKAGELKSFMNYYLPKTLKILENYAKLEEQDVDGDNIRETKQKIEAMMDKIVDGYEAQLDKLFADDALDISAELKVMESMLEKDGLTADNELKL